MKLIDKKQEGQWKVEIEKDDIDLLYGACLELFEDVYDIELKMGEMLLPEKLLLSCYKRFKNIKSDTISEFRLKKELDAFYEEYRSLNP